MNNLPLYKNGVTGLWDGYCRKIETWGSDERVIETARMSTDGAFRGWGPKITGIPKFEPNAVRRELTPEELAEALDYSSSGSAFSDIKEESGDEKLLKYMWENQHYSPFEFAGLVVEFQVPIFVIRQVHRHRAASYSELSARYTEMPDLFWVPTPAEVRRQGGSNRQGSVGDESEEWQRVSADAVTLMARSNEGCRMIYEELLKMGVAREQARSVLPVAQFTRCRMQCNLRMLIHFLQLRTDSHAQRETRMLAGAMAHFARQAFPRTLALGLDAKHEEKEVGT